MKNHAVMHVYEVPQRKDRRDIDLVSDALPFGRLWCDELNVRGAATPRSDHPKRFPKPVGWICARPSAAWLAQYM